MNIGSAIRLTLVAGITLLFCGTAVVAGESGKSTKLTFSVDLLLQQKRETTVVHINTFQIIYMDNFVFVFSKNVTGQIDPFERTIVLSDESTSRYLEESLTDSSLMRRARVLSAFASWNHDPDQSDVDHLDCFQDDYFDELLKGLYSEAVTTMIMAAIPDVSDTNQFSFPPRGNCKVNSTGSNTKLFATAKPLVLLGMKKKIKTYALFDLAPAYNMPPLDYRHGDSTMNRPIPANYKAMEETRGIRGRVCEVGVTLKDQGVLTSMVVKLVTAEPFFVDPETLADHGENWERVPLDSVVGKGKK